MSNRALRKRLTAAGLAVLTVFGMYQGSVSSIASSYSNDYDLYGDGEIIVGSGGSISTRFTVDGENTYQKIDSIDFTAYVPTASGSQLSYNWKVVSDGATLAQGSGSATSADNGLLRLASDNTNKTYMSSEPSPEPTPGAGDDNQAGGDNNSAGGDNNQNGGDNTPAGGDDNQNGGDNNSAGGDNNQAGGDNTPAGGDNTPAGGDNNQAGGDNTQVGGDNNQNGDANQNVEPPVQAPLLAAPRLAAPRAAAPTPAEVAKAISITHADLSNLKLAKGQSVTVSVSFPSGATVCNGGLLTINTSQAEAPTDVTSISFKVSVNNSSTSNTATTYTMSADQAANTTLSIEAIPNIANRPVSFTNNTGLSISQNGNTVEIPAGMTAGMHSITAASGTLDVPFYFYIYDATIADQTYTGGAIEPSIEVADGKNAGAAAMSSTGYTVAWQNNVNAGTATAAITINENNFTFNKNFVINPKTIAESDFSSATWSVNSSTGAATATGISIAATDYEATATRKSATAGSATYDIDVVGKNNYKGSIQLTNKTVAGSGTSLVDINDVFSVTIDDSDIVYDGTQKTPNDKLTFTSIADGNPVSDLISGGYVTCSYTNNINAGDEAKCTITGVESKGYKGSIELYFTIAQKDISGATLTLGDPAIHDGSGYYAIHTGSQIKPPVTVVVDSHTLTTDDFDVTYQNNTNINNTKPTVIVEGIGNYTGSAEINFAIVADVQKDIYIKLGTAGKAAVVNGKATTGFSLPYTGSAVEPSTYAVYVGSSTTPLPQSGNYTVEFSDNTAAGNGTAKATFTFTGKLNGTVEATYSITPISISTATVTNPDTSFVYDGTPKSLDNLTVTRAGLPLNAGDDYDISYSTPNPTNVGTYTVTLTGNGNYTGTKTTTFSITPLDLSDSSVAINSIPAQPYTGSTIKPPVVLTINGTPVTSGYTVNYVNAENVGTATVKVTANSTVGNNLTGTRTTTFEITKKSMGDLVYKVNGNTLTVSGNTAASGYSVGYDGTGKKLANLTIVDSSTGRTLEQGTDYKVVYTNNTSVGTASASIQGLADSNYDQTTPVTITFTITQRNIKNGLIDIVQGTVPTTPTAGVILPTFTITDNANAILKRNPLVLGRDYTVTAKDNCVKAGDSVCTITGIGNYTGEVDVDFSIGTSIDNAKVILVNPHNNAVLATFPAQTNSTQNIPYIGDVTPKVMLDIDGVKTELATLNIEKSEHLSTWSGSGGDIYNSFNGNNVISFTLNAEESTAYFGTRTLTYRIQKVSLSNATIKENDPSTATDFEYIYTGNKFKVVPTGSNSDSGTGKVYLEINGMVVPTSEYTVKVGGTTTNEFGPAKGEYTVSFNGTSDASSNFMDSKSQKYTITGGEFNTMSLVSSDLSYTGSEVKPKVVLKDKKGNTLVEGVDYELTYSNNVAVSTPDAKASVTAHGLDNYPGQTKTLEFEITQVDFATQKAAGKLTITADTIDYPGQKEGGTALDVDDINLVLRLNGVALERGADKDYTATITNVNKVGLASQGGTDKAAKVTVTGTGLGKYTGEADFYVTVRGDLTKYFNAELELDVTSLNAAAWNALTADNVKVCAEDNSAYRLSSDLYTISKSSTAPGQRMLTIIGKDGAYNRLSIPIIVTGSFNDATISLNPKVYDYTGLAIEPLPIVKYGTETVPSTQYHLSYDSDHTNVGVGKHVNVIPLETSNYWTDTIGETYDIVYNLSTAKVTLDPSMTTFTGNPVTPSVKVEIGDHIVDSGYYDVTYANNEDVGTGTVTIKAKTGVAARGQQTKSFKINAITNVDYVKFADTLTESVQKVYTGDAIEPQLVVKFGDLPLVKGKDYTVTYTNNVNATTSTTKAHAHVDFIGNYSGSKDLDFEITPKDIAESDVNISFDTTYFTGQNTPPEPTYSMSYNGRTLTINTDYTKESVSYTGSGKYGTGAAQIKINGAGNFKGTKTYQYDIEQLDLGTNSGVIINAKSVYDGNNQYSLVNDNVSMFYNGDELNKENYTVTVEGGLSNTQMVDAGTYQIKITGTNGFTGTKYTDYTIEPAEITNASGVLNSARFNPVKVNSVDNTYTGSPVTPGVTIKDVQWKTNQVYELVEGTDYELVYANNQTSSAGADANGPSVTIRGKNNYKGEYTIPFNIGTKLTDENTSYVFTNNGVSQFTYDGKSHVPVIDRITYHPGEADEKILVAGTDYDIVAHTEDDVNAGDKTITIRGKGAFYGEYEIPYKIVEKDPNLTQNKIRVILPDMRRDALGHYYTTYTGYDIEPAVKVYDDEISTTKPLVRDLDYDVTYIDNHNVGVQKATVKVTLTRNYNNGGDVPVVYFDIRGHEMGTMSVTLDSTKVPYDAALTTIAPIETVTYDDGVSHTRRELTKSQDGVTGDYKLDYLYYGYDSLDPNCDNPENIPVAGPAKLVITGLGNYTGQLTADYIIYGNLEDINYIIPDQVYTGEKIIPDITQIECGGRKLKASDVRVSTTSTDNFASNGTLYIDENNDYYTGRWTGEFNIVFDATNIQVAPLTSDTFEYTGAPIEPAFQITTKSGAAVPASAVAITYKNLTNGVANDHTNVGTIEAKITVTVGAKTLDLTKTFKIIPKDINNTNVTIVKTQYYNGTELTPYMEVRRPSDNRKLVEGTEFTIEKLGDSAGNKVNPTNADDPCKIRIAGVGNYTGTRDVEYVIESPALLGLSTSNSTANSIDLNWARSRYASGYIVMKPDGTKVKISDPATTTYTVTGLNSAQNYEFKVATYVTIGNVDYIGSYSSVNAETGMSKATATGSSTSSQTATVSWIADNGVIGYRIYRSTSQDSGYSLIAIIPKSKSTYTDGNLTSGKTYYYKIQSYKYQNGGYVYGPMSDAVTITPR